MNLQLRDYQYGMKDVVSWMIVQMLLKEMINIRDQFEECQGFSREQDSLKLCALIGLKDWCFYWLNK